MPKKFYLCFMLLSLGLFYKSASQIYTGSPAIGIRIDTINIGQNLWFSAPSSGSAVSQLYLNCDTMNNVKLTMSASYWISGAGSSWASTSYLLLLDSNIEIATGILPISTLGSGPTIIGAQRINLGVFLNDNYNSTWSTNDSVVFNKNMHSPLLTEYWYADFPSKYIAIRKKYGNEYLYGWMLAQAMTSMNYFNNTIFQITKFPKLNVIYDTISCTSSYTFIDGITLNNILHDTIYDFVVPSTTLGCDSLIRTKLTVIPPYPTTIIYDTICAGVSYIFPDSSVLSNTNLDTAHVNVFTLGNGCDSIIVSNLHVVHKDTTYELIPHCYNSSYTFPDGYIKHNIYYNYTHLSVLNTANGCDSIVITTMKVIPKGSGFSMTVCDSFYFNNQYLTSSGLYYDTLSNVLGCDSLITLLLSIMHVSINSVAATPATICDQANVSLEANCSSPNYCIPNFIPYYPFHCIINFNFNGVINNASGNFSDIYTYYNQTANVMAGSSYNFSIIVSSGSSSAPKMVWIDFNQDGVFSNALEMVFFNTSWTGSVTIPSTAYNGITRIRVATVDNFNIYSSNCHVLGLTNSGEFEDYNLNISGGLSNISWSPPNFLNTTNGNIVAAQNINATTTYTVTATNGVGCTGTSSVTINVLNSSSDTLTATACNSYLYNGQTQTSSGFYFDTLLNAVGCDSLVVLQLTILPTTSDTLLAQICIGDTLFYNGNNYTTAGYYINNFTNGFGCDSNITIHLSVNPVNSDTLLTQICSGDTLLFNGNNYSTAGYYINNFTNVFGCDSIITVNLNVYPSHNSSIIFNGTTLIVSGGYSSYLWYQDGVTFAITTDSTIVVSSNGTYYAMLTDSNGCIEFSDTILIHNLKSSDISTAEYDIKVYPNPAIRKLSVAYNCITKGEFILLNDIGQQVYHCTLPANRKKMDINMPPLSKGIYFYHCKFESCADAYGKLSILE